MSEFVFDGLCRECPYCMSTKISADPLSSLLYKCNKTCTIVGPLNYCTARKAEVMEESKDETPTVDFYKIIDDAIEKHDRSISIFISPDGITINVYPLTNDDPKEWKRIKGVAGYGDLYICPYCGSGVTQPTIYCGECGERVNYPNDDVLRKEE